MNGMIPVLPMTSMPETLAFYELLGFLVTHRQTAPNVYAATRRGPLHLHFFGGRDVNPNTCLAIVPEVEVLHATFAEAMRSAYGKVPTTGAPRITRMKKGQSRFTVVDVNGNSVIFIRDGAPDDYDEAANGNTSTTPLGKALRAAARLRDFKNDDAAAAKVLDVALKKGGGTEFERAQVMLARAELANSAGNTALVESLRESVERVMLSEDERRQIRLEFARSRAV